MPEPGKLFVEMPVLHVTAILAQKARERYSKGLWYDCPVYTKKKRTDLNYVYTPKVRIPSAEKKRKKKGNPMADPSFWVKMGVAMLCSID